ncbi:MAG TPA: glycerol-3-phosphate 1-O-acyltransferase PlsY [Vicinamibacteria bacterium]|nr:glycerol-3-phosphate 1-O-acyltransferase PlsY [Vicinamibacteria bacterium]
MGHGLLTAVALAAAYLLGSIPFSYLVARGKGIDVRTVGSGNVGATNVMRSAGRAAGLAAFALDFLKGSLATWLAFRLAGPTIAAVAAVIAVLGHMYPAWLSFKGGKGVATGAGAFLPILPVAAVIGLLTFGVVAWLTRYASVGSIAGTTALPVVALLMRAPAASTIAAAIAAALIVWKHRENIRRLAAGSERRMGAGKEGTP